MVGLKSQFGHGWSAKKAASDQRKSLTTLEKRRFGQFGQVIGDERDPDSKKSTPRNERTKRSKDTERKKHRVGALIYI